MATWNPAMLPGYNDEPTPEQLEEYCQRLQMDDAELIREGKDGAYLCSPQANWGRAPRKVFMAHLKECRAEWRRRHPKS